MYNDLKGKKVVVRTDAHVDPKYYGRLSIKEYGKVIVLEPGLNQEETRYSGNHIMEDVDQNGTRIEISLDKIVSVAKFKQHIDDA